MSVYVPEAVPRQVSPAFEAYERIAPVYDLLTAGYDHPTWLDSLEGLALEHGLSGSRLLDIGCGTGKSFMPMLDRGYRVSACDVSPAMVELARAKVGASAELFVADMRELAWEGEANLITCLDDAVNYLLTIEDVAAALCGMERALAPGGLAVFDVNTLSTYRSSFALDFALEGPDSFLVWRGQADREAFAPGEVAEAAIEIFEEEPDGRWRRVTSRHVQRHHPREELEAAIEEAGLELVAVRGQARGGLLELEADELLHPKLVYLARKPARRRPA
jgi:ubiquinone/menaquinone biosynthesis C-methylase UbiE